MNASLDASDSLNASLDDDASLDASLDKDAQAPALALPPRREDVYAWLEEDGLRPDQALARRIAYVFHTGLVACAAGDHARWQAVHEAHCADHGGLARTWGTLAAGYTVPSTSELPQWTNQLGLRCPVRPLGAAARQFTRSDLPSAARLEAAYSGWPDVQRYAATEVCLHEDDRPMQVLAAAVHDVDSFLHITRDPTDFEGPLDICLAPQPASLLSKSVHVQIPVQVDGRTIQAPLHRVPHMVFARRGRDIVHLFFPRLYRPTRATAAVYLTNTQYQQFFDGLVRPSFAAIGQAFAHHVPGSFSSVQASAQAATEATGTSAARGGSVEVSFHTANLRQLWDAMRTALDRADATETLGGDRALRQFSDPVFMYGAKNTKLQYQAAQPRASTVGAAIHEFTKTAVVAPYYGEAPTEASRWPQDGRSQLIDVAAEFVPAQDGYTALARRCCQYNTLLFLEGSTGLALFGEDRAIREAGHEAGHERCEDGDGDGEESDEGYDGDDGDDEAAEAADTEPGLSTRWAPPRIPRTTTTEYPVHMLRDSVSLTCEPRKTSRLRKNGVVYVQTYTVAEGQYNVNGVWAFSHNNLYNLGHSHEVWASLAQRGGVAADRTSAERALHSSCRRMVANLAETARGHGWRVEIRMTTELARLVQEAEASWATLLSGPSATPPAAPHAAAADLIRADRHGFFVVEARVFNTFVQQNLDKYVRLLDYIVALYKNDIDTPQAAAALYAVTVVALQQFISYRRDVVRYTLTASLDAPRGRRAGLGVAEAMAVRGFGFVPARGVDWETLQIRDWLVDRLQIPQLAVRTRWQTDGAMRQTYIRFDQAIQVAADPRVPTTAAGDAVLSALAQLVLNEYKRSVYFAMARQEPSDDDLASLAFTYAGLAALTKAKNDRSIATPQNDKYRFRSAADYFRWAFTAEHYPGNRRRIQALQYYVMARKVVHALDHSAHTGHVSSTRFLVLLYYRFCQQIGCFPSPDVTNGVLSVTQVTGKRIVLCLILKHFHDDVPPYATLTDTVALVTRHPSKATVPRPSLLPARALSDLRVLRRLASLPRGET